MYVVNDDVNRYGIKVMNGSGRGEGGGYNITIRNEMSTLGKNIISVPLQTSTNKTK